MIVCKVLCALFLMLLLIGMIRVGVWIHYDGTLTVKLSLGMIRVQLTPSKKRRKEKKETEQKVPKEKKKPIPKPNFSDIRSAADTLWPPLKKALRRTRRGIRIDPLRVQLTFGGRDDPAAAAEYYGYGNAAIWTAMPALERLVKIPDPRIELSVDYEKEGLQACGEAGISIRIGTVIGVGLQIGIPALKWFLQFQKKAAKRAKQPVKERLPGDETAA